MKPSTKLKAENSGAVVPSPVFFVQQRSKAWAEGERRPFILVLFVAFNGCRLNRIPSDCIARNINKNKRIDYASKV